MLDEFYAESRRTEENASPEHNLWKAVIECAIRDIITGMKKKRTGRESNASRNNMADALRWIMSGKRNGNSFVVACEILDIDPSKIRKHIKEIVGVDPTWQR